MTIASRSVISHITTALRLHGSKLSTYCKSLIHILTWELGDNLSQARDRVSLHHSISPFTQLCSSALGPGTFFCEGLVVLFSSLEPSGKGGFRGSEAVPKI
jgi:hypothetical protein